jgi:hypothetical protein
MAVIYRLEPKEDPLNLGINLKGWEVCGNRWFSVVDNWVPTFLPSIEDDENFDGKFSRGMWVGCTSIEDLFKWFPPKVSVMEQLRKVEAVLAIYAVDDDGLTQSTNQCIFYPKQADLLVRCDWEKFVKVHRRNKRKRMEKINE